MEKASYHMVIQAPCTCFRFWYRNTGLNEHQAGVSGPGAASGAAAGSPLTPWLGLCILCLPSVQQSAAFSIHWGAPSIRFSFLFCFSLSPGSCFDRAFPCNLPSPLPSECWVNVYKWQLGSYMGWPCSKRRNMRKHLCICSHYSRETSSHIV